MYEGEEASVANWHRLRIPYIDYTPQIIDEKDKPTDVAKATDNTVAGKILRGEKIDPAVVVPFETASNLGKMYGFQENS